MSTPTLDEQFVRELLASEPAPPPPAKQPKQSKAHRRREAQLRGAACRRVLNQANMRHCTRLIDALVEYTSISNKLPWPSQKALAKLCGVTDRTIRNWLVICEKLGIIEVFRSKPKFIEGQWKRKTNRYLLCNRRATSIPAATPLRRRHCKHKRKSISSNPSGLELVGVATTGDDPPQHVDDRFSETQGQNEISSRSKTLSLPALETNQPLKRNSEAAQAARKLARKLLNDAKK